FLPLSLLVLAIFTFGLSLALSAIAVYFLDLREMYTVALTALMYLTPIIYPASIIPVRFKAFIQLNPFTYMVAIVRTPVFEGTLPSPNELGIASALAIASVIMGWAIFRRLSRGFYPYL
ncbi:MAG TPA: ABC transporter permease, partial [Thermoanaerobaculia bacterium]|nr:ABC transporter permease [Thermoanaerobaculia bacterium]